MKKKRKRENCYSSIGSAVFFNGPTSFNTESFQDFIVITVFRQIIVPLRPQSRVNFGRYSSPPSLSPPVVLSLPPRRFPPAVGRRGCSVRTHWRRLRVWCCGTRRRWFWPKWKDRINRLTRNALTRCCCWYWNEMFSSSYGVISSSYFLFSFDLVLLLLKINSTT